MQLGMDPQRAILLDLADPSAAELLELLDGAHTEETVLAEGARRGLSETTTRDFLRDLTAARLLISAEDLLPAALAPDVRERIAGEAGALAHAADGRSPATVLRRRRDQRVVIAGAGRLVALISHGLLDAGVGRVATQTAGARGPRRVVAATGATAPVRVAAASLVVDVRTVLAPAPATPRRPVLAVTVREGVVVVGPLVPAAGGPCLRCLDLHRIDRDPGWPSLAAQLKPDPATAPCRSATVLAAAGFVVGEALELLDGGKPTTIGGCIEVSGPSTSRRRAWPRHPSCDC
ncbi:hypothetical protein F4553_005084 [Allocatelliglobosispora scoriae]|uniref:Bacteriocin biosynthesis cyclodehydratase domain-containing protein n=1 Tax=Allocatelliglobosispora scoriae TaxID=643052 RepID=A0A841BVK2_9ACTN|nr:hypothetical protein [Allocatelliglobosispora scoriae]MBB5871705.1 hypothetical protein [Allocatelliglobosispora scoriae]